MPQALQSTPSDKDVRSALLKSKAMDTSATGIAITDADGLYVYMNQAHARIFGYDTPEQMYGMHWSVLYSEQMLAERERFLSSLIENSGSLIYVKNKDRKFTLWNRKSEKEIGLSRMQILGRSSTEVFGEETGQLFEETDRLVLEHGETVDTMESIGPAENRRHLAGEQRGG